MVTDMRLPADLIAFLTAGHQLAYDVSLAEPGNLLLRSFEELRLREIYHSSAKEGHAPGCNEEPGAGEDPHLDDGGRGYYAIPAVDLVASCTGDYPPEALLFWLPDQQMFGTWDGGHFELLVFPGIGWSEIVANPVEYLNAQWSEDPPGYYFAPWHHGYEYRWGWPKYPSDWPD